MHHLAKGGVEVLVPDHLFRDYEQAVLHIAQYFKEHSELHRLPAVITKSAHPHSVSAAFDLEEVGIHPMFMKDRMVERWSSQQRKDPKTAVGTDVINYLGAFYVIEWHRMAFLYSMLRAKLIHAGMDFTHMDDGRLTQTIRFDNQQFADVVYELMNKEVEPA